MPESRKTAMVSSTTIDMPIHREEVLNACLRQGVIPLMMEHLPASGADPIRESLKMVEDADLYLGVLGHRYGYVPPGHDVSITQMEYERALERAIPILLFLMHADHTLIRADVETGPNAAKLEALKSRMLQAHVTSFFRSPEDLRGHVIDALSKLRDRRPAELHYVRDIPKPPEAYIAHPYTLLSTSRLIGRQQELNYLTDWVARPASEVFAVRVLSVVAIGGMGKSALTWKWFNEIAPHEMTPLAGRLWWSFYESDAHVENFLVRALAYVSDRSRADIEALPPAEREEQLLSVLDRTPFLVALDGLERVLVAYARMDAARLADDDLDERTSNQLAGARGMPASAAQAFVGQHPLRKAADPRVGAFLRRLAMVRASRILISTRLYPADLQTPLGMSVLGATAHFLGGLTPDDALDLWRAFNVSGPRDQLLALFARFEHYPLLIRALATEVAFYRRAPGDFAQWQQDHPDFDPFRLPLVQVKSHVLAHALDGLDGSARQVLETIAAFRMPASYDTLTALLVGTGRLFPDDRGLDGALSDLEDRGLVGWDRRANRYDLHPIVRGVAWATVKTETRRDLYTKLKTHFEALPAVADDEVTSLDDLTIAIEIYDKLIGLERYEDAWSMVRSRLSNSLIRLHATRQFAELLSMLFPDGIEAAPRLRDPEARSGVTAMLALAYQWSGRPGEAVGLARRAGEHRIEYGHLIVMGYPSALCGRLREAEAYLLRGLGLAEERNAALSTLGFLGLTLAIRGRWDDALRALTATVVEGPLGPDDQSFPQAYLAQLALWRGDLVAASAAVDTLVGLVPRVATLRQQAALRAERMQGAVALSRGDLGRAADRLSEAVTRAHAVNHAEEGLPALVGLAEVRRRQGDLAAARGLLAEARELAERGPYPVFHADACAVLARIGLDEGDRAAAAAAATQAYRLAWCDGPPFAYHWGLEEATRLLRELEVPEPADLPPFDESRFEPMPDVAIEIPARLRNKK